MCLSAAESLQQTHDLCLSSGLIKNYSELQFEETVESQTGSQQMYWQLDEDAVSFDLLTNTKIKNIVSLYEKLAVQDRVSTFVESVKPLDVFF